MTDAAEGLFGISAPGAGLDESSAASLAAAGVPVVYLVGDDHGGAVVVVAPDGSVTEHDAPDLATRFAGRAAKALRRLMLDLSTPVAQHRFRTQLGNLSRGLGVTVGRLLHKLAGANHRLLLVPVGSLAGIPMACRRG
ncbi:MAG TPA: hypothetical protein VK992_03990 [Candidatus Caenarcaniphilales bacterium]|nr:hypothetical protein [Candidatus Caenarcaniphilales bacterium]